MEIAITNESTRVSDLTVARWADAVNRQVQRDVLPVWGGAVRDLWVEFDAQPESVDWVIRVLDTSDYPGAAGYHTFDDDGRPWGTVFLDAGLEPSVVLSHEVLEAIADPAVNRTALNWNDGYAYAMEICDPVQSDTYAIDGIKVSNFVYPAWFGMESDARVAHRYAWRIDPFEIADGGYAVRYGDDGREEIGSALPGVSTQRITFR